MGLSGIILARGKDHVVADMHMGRLGHDEMDGAGHILAVRKIGDRFG